MKFVLGRRYAAALALIPALATVTACGGGNHNRVDLNSLSRPTPGTTITGQAPKPLFDTNACLKRHGITILAPGQQRPKSQRPALNAALAACMKEAKAKH